MSVSLPLVKIECLECGSPLPRIPTIEKPVECICGSIWVGYILDGKLILAKPEEIVKEKVVVKEVIKVVEKPVVIPNPNPRTVPVPRYPDVTSPWKDCTYPFRKWKDHVTVASVLWTNGLSKGVSWTK
ncbi:hypothetical protein [Candidatus Borrarchaeum sp.]|uniref:hypothetical protein n=1 Tax=Candidatus Borrarchaeum sp. TaxID=2846742 RepID=UPI00257A1C6E|nr:hypothetical protein [Candidatus Borrarchaeum sp.]